MNWFQRIFGPSEVKGYHSANKGDLVFFQGIGDFGSREFTSVAAALRAGYTIASGMGLLPLTAEGRGGDDLAALLNDEPNDLLTGVEFKELLTLHAVFSGTGRAFIRRNALGKVQELLPLHPGWCGQWTYHNGQYVLPVTIEDAGVRGDFTRDDILEITSPRWNMLGGLDVTNACRHVLGLSRKLQQKQAQYADTNAPYGVMFVKEGESKGAVARLKESWSKQFGRSGIAVVDMDGKFQQLAQSSTDQQLNEALKFQVEEIARIYGVHPYFLMQTAGSGAQGAVADAMLFHQAQTMAPWITRWEAALKRSLFRNTQSVPNFDENALMRTTPQVRAEIYARALGGGGNAPWMTPDEVREGQSPFNLPAKGDAFWTTGNTGGGE
ncbi:phage portal protein [Falsirhodobacter halotolerans]|uniref:phage portal protein n=1 Tax=Falsirhodobacter halotolerans TaxID=1146892 RepID=UPI001FD151D2|nr:phage portal protein [Falsirhodobacter halotolerans]MCJ8138597.1 phage portal protein [Falsirhodobacter halotolerans]